MKNGILQKKKFIKKVVLAFLSLFIMVQSYITNVHALSNVITYNNYGSFEWSNVNFQLGNANYGGVALTGNLNQYYTGTIRLNFSGYNSVSFGVILTEGTYISDYGTNYIVLTLQGVNYFQLTLAGTQANVNALTFNSFSNWNLTAVGAYSEIQEVHRIKLDVGSILTALNGVKTNTAYLDDIYIEVQSINDDLEAVKTQLYNIYQGIQLNIPIYSIDAYMYMQKFGTITNRFSYYSYYIKYPSIQLNSTQTSGYDTKSAIGIGPNEELSFIYITSIWRNPFSVYINNSGEGTVYYRNLKEFNGERTIYMTYKNTTNNRQYISINYDGQFNNEYIIPLYLGTNIPSVIADEYGLTINNTYTKQNQTIIDKLTELINKQNNIVIKEEDKTEVNTNINNYNNVMTDINGIEINFKNEFNTSNESIQTQDLTPSHNLQDSRIVLSGVFNTFLDEFAFIKTWLILLLICAIALILLGH